MTIYEKLFNIKQAWIKLQRDTQAYNYKYATLDQIQEKLWKELEKEKLLVVHYISWWLLTTEIRDIESNEFVRSEIELTTIKPQEKGSEITYFRRYNLLSLLDLEVEDDDWKKAQDSKEFKGKDDKPWFNQPEFKKLEKHKSAYTSWEEAIQKISEKYKINKEMRQNILNLYE